MLWVGVGVSGFAVELACGVDLCPLLLTLFVGFDDCFILMSSKLVASSEMIFVASC